MPNLTQKQQERLLKIKNALNKGNLGLVSLFIELEDRLDKEIPDIAELISKMKGDKGDTYELTKEDRKQIAKEATNLIQVEEVGKAVLKFLDKKEVAKLATKLIKVPKNGKTPTDKDLIKLIKPLIPEQEPFVVDEMGIAKKAVDLFRDSIEIPEPDMAEDIRNKLELLEGDERISFGAIRESEEILSDIKELKERQPQVIETVSGGGGSSLHVTEEGVSRRQSVTKMDFGSGFGVTSTANGVLVTLDGSEPTNYTLQAVTDNGNTTDNSIEALSFIKTGGVSTDFLKADGSVDTNTYLAVETDPIFIASQAFNIDATDITNLGNLSGVNTGDQTLASFGTDNQIPYTNAGGTDFDYSDDLIFDGDLKVTGGVRIIGDELTLDNHQAIRMRDNIGGVRDVMILNSGNQLRIASSGGFIDSVLVNGVKFTIDGGAPDLALLADHPTGDTDLAISTTKYVDDGMDKANDNIMLNSFRIAINGSLSQFQMVDRVVDEYEDETGVDTADSSNELYNPTTDYYSPSGADLGDGLILHYKMNDDDNTTTVVDSEGTSNGTLYGGDNTEDITQTGKINSALLENGTDDYIDSNYDIETLANTGQFSVSLWMDMTDGRPPSGDNSGFFGVQNGSNERLYARVTHGGESTQGGIEMRVKANGAQSAPTTTGNFFSDGQTGWHHLVFVFDYAGNSLRLYHNGVEVTSGGFASATWGSVDPANWNFSGKTMLVGGINLNGSPNYWFDGALDDFRLYDKVLSTDEIASIYNSGSGTESASGSPSDMTLISEDTEAETTPTSARVVILEEDVDAVTVNTDMKAYVSRDDGTTYSQITLSDEGDFDATKRILVGDVDVSGQPSDKTMRYKITTHNGKDLKVHGTSLLWD